MVRGVDNRARLLPANTFGYQVSNGKERWSYERMLDVNKRAYAAFAAEQLAINSTAVGGVRNDQWRKLPDLTKRYWRRRAAPPAPHPPGHVAVPIVLPPAPAPTIPPVAAPQPDDDSISESEDEEHNEDMRGIRGIPGGRRRRWKFAEEIYNRDPPPEGDEIWSSRNSLYAAVDPQNMVVDVSQSNSVPR